VDVKGVGVKNGPSDVSFEFNIRTAGKLFFEFICPVKGLTEKINLPVRKKIIMQA
jgi:hypothetical protein